MLECRYAGMKKRTEDKGWRKAEESPALEGTRHKFRNVI